MLTFSLNTLYPALGHVSKGCRLHQPVQKWLLSHPHWATFYPLPRYYVLDTIWVLDTVWRTKVLAINVWENILKPLNAVKTNWNHPKILYFIGWQIWFLANNKYDANKCYSGSSCIGILFIKICMIISNRFIPLRYSFHNQFYLVVFKENAN